MNGFLAAQADDPFDPAPMLILADHLEEAGDEVGAAVLRGLVESGKPSLHSLALEAMLRSTPWQPDMFEHGYGDGAGDGDGEGSGYGSGPGDWFQVMDGGGGWSGYGDGPGDVDWRADE